MSEARAKKVEEVDPSNEATVVKGIPATWAWSTIGDFCAYIQRGKSPKYAKQSDLPVINQKCVRWNKLQTEHVKFVHPDQWDKWAEIRFVVPGDVLWNSTGTGTIGRAYHISNPPPLKRCVVDSHITILRSKPEFEPRYLYYFIRSPLIQQKIEDMQTGSTNQVELGRNVIFETRIPIAPLAEQRRIVSKIDELFSDIEAGERALKRARAALVRYRKSVLKAAVTGDLTADWRAANRERLEPAEKLLARIFAARREAWEKAERGKLKAQGKSPKGEEWKRKYKEPAAPTPPDGFILPESWTWAGFSQVGEFGRGKSKHRPRNDPKLFGGNYPFLQTGVVRQSNGRIREYDQTYNDVGLAQSKLWPAGTICITIAANIAASGILEIDACFPDSIVGLVPEKETQGRYIEMFVRTARAELDRFAPATAQKNINLEILGDVAIPFPPAKEQIEIVSRADEALSKADHVEAALDEQERAARALKQSILKAAFEGRLVPQDPADEPAAKLLKRIKAPRGKVK